MYNQVVDFIKSLYPEKDFIALHEPSFRGNEKEYLIQCIDTGYVSSVGEFVNKFELKLAEYLGVKHAVVIVNGTEALHLALVVCDVGRDDEVITQPLTFIATGNAITYTGAHPIFVDVDKDTMGLSPVALKSFLINNSEIKQGKCFNKTTGRQIKACVPMHTFGHPVRLDEIAEICSEFNILLIEDAAESIGSLYKGNHTGTKGKLGVLSFNGNKTITTGGGGAIVTNHSELAYLAKHLSTQSKIPHPWEYKHDFVGYNYRMPNINAALGLAQLEQLDDIIKNKRLIAQHYKDFFASYSDIQFVEEPIFSKSNYWLNSILFENREKREQFLKFTNEHGVMTRPIWSLLYRSPMYQHCQRTLMPNAEWLEDRIVNIPSGLMN